MDRWYQSDTVAPPRSAALVSHVPEQAERRARRGESRTGMQLTCWEEELRLRGGYVEEDFTFFIH